jgi:hypothetical protein
MRRRGSWRANVSANGATGANSLTFGRTIGYSGAATHCSDDAGGAAIM